MTASGCRRASEGYKPIGVSVKTDAKVPRLGGTGGVYPRCQRGTSLLHSIGDDLLEKGVDSSDHRGIFWVASLRADMILGVSFPL